MPDFTNMDGVDELLREIEIPPFTRVAQLLPRQRAEDPAAELRRSIRERQLAQRITPGQRIAVAVGSRQIRNLDRIVAELIRILRENGAEPYIIPAMGSHGGATAEGQREILADYGIDEARMGAPVLADMAVSQIGVSEEGDPVYAANDAIAADGLILVNRVKPHPSFSGTIESGLTKMSVIGLGKQKGAEYCHRRGVAGFSQRLQRMSRVVLEKLPVLFGVAILENPYDETAEVHAIPAERIPEEEPQLLLRAREYMPRLLPEALDVLIIEEIGKNISGTGADPNVMGRFISPYKSSDREPPRRIVMLDLTPETHGAAAGIGQADFIPAHLFEQIDYGKIYINSLTSTQVGFNYTPLVMANDQRAIQAAIKTCGKTDPQELRIALIKNTLEIGELLVSPAIAREAHGRADLQLRSEPFPLRFSREGRLENGL